MTSYPWKKKKCKSREKSIAVSGSLNIVCHSPFSNSNFVRAYACVSKRARPTCVHLGFSVRFVFELGILIFLYLGQKITFKNCILTFLNTSFVIKEVESCVCSLASGHIFLDATMAYSLLHSLCNNLTW